MTTFAHKTQNLSSTVNPIKCKLVLDFFSESLSTHTRARVCVDRDSLKKSKTNLHFIGLTVLLRFWVLWAKVVIL